MSEEAGGTQPSKDVAHERKRASSGSGSFDVAFGGPTASSWREQALTRVAEIEDLADAFEPALEDETKRILVKRIHRHVQTARHAAEGKPDDSQRKRRGWTRFKALVGGSPLERTASNIDAAEVDLLRIAPPEYFGISCMNRGWCSPAG